MKKDRFFAKKKKTKPFEFNAQVTEVFDDMLNRSVPFYGESIRRQAQMTKEFYRPGTRIYDLGCSHGNLGLAIADQMKEAPFSLIGVDSSIPMILKYAERLKQVDIQSGIHLVCGFLEDLKIKKASVVLINLTLQFLSPLKRDELIQSIYDGMVPGGILLLTEKIVHPSQELDRLQQSFYRRFKLENGYSQLEISQKRDALEKVLIPDTVDTHFNRMKNAGFTEIDVWLKWFNFASMAAIKN